MGSDSESFKARMVRRMLWAERISALALSQEVGVGRKTLSKWAREARSLPPTGGVTMAKKKRRASHHGACGATLKP